MATLPQMTRSLPPMPPTTVRRHGVPSVHRMVTMAPVLTM